MVCDCRTRTGRCAPTCASRTAGGRGPGNGVDAPDLRGIRNRHEITAREPQPQPQQQPPAARAPMSPRTKALLVLGGIVAAAVIAGQLAGQEDDE